jgi:hypothetical protein
MAASEKDPLRDRFERELSTLADDAASSDSNILSDRIELLNSLAKLIETRDSLRPKPHNWWPPVVLACTLMIVSVLLFARVRETEIELDVSVAQASFSLHDAQVLSDPIDLSALGISGLRAVQLPEAQNPHTTEIPPAGKGGQPASFVSASVADERHGIITLAPIVLPSGAIVRLSCSDAASQYRLSLNADGLQLQAAVNGTVKINTPGSPNRLNVFANPKQIIAQGGNEELNLDLTLSSPRGFAFSPQMEIRELDLMRTDQFLEPDRTFVKHQSTIHSGTLFLESLNGQVFKLRPGEELHFAHSDGEIRSLVLTPNHIDLKYHGTVAGMTAGTGEGHHSIMPTYLDWLKARHGLSLLWATALYLFGLAAAALRWAGVRL